jgi:ADP-ribose pyrophosphatase
MDVSKVWKIKSEKELLSTKIFKITEMECFLQSKNMNHRFYKMKISDWINVFSLTDDGKIILVKQHRLGKNIVTHEVPAGAITENEDPLLGAKRELQEETGYTSDNVVLLKKISANPAIQNNNCYFFIALNCKKTDDTNFDPAEELDLVLKDKKEIFDIINSGFMDNSLSFLAVMLAKEYLSKAGLL